MMGFGLGFGLIGLIFMLLVGAGIIGGTILLVRALFPGSGGIYRAESTGSAQPRSALETLDLRFARGEISREEYQSMKADLS